MERRKLTDEEIASALSTVVNWSTQDDRLKKRFSFSNFAEALDFVNRVGAIAEAADHHPDITFGWGYAEIATTTHDRSGVTDFDIDLADKIDSLEQ